MRRGGTEGMRVLPRDHSATARLHHTSARCNPAGGICYSSLLRDGGRATTHLDCWPRQTTGQLVWFGVHECKNEVERLVCLQ